MPTDWVAISRKLFDLWRRFLSGRKNASYLDCDIFYETQGLCSLVTTEYRDFPFFARVEFQGAEGELVSVILPGLKHGCELATRFNFDKGGPGPFLEAVTQSMISNLERELSTVPMASD